MKILSIKKLDEIDGIVYAEITYRSWFRNVTKLVFLNYSEWRYEDGSQVFVRVKEDYALSARLSAHEVMQKYKDAQVKKREAERKEADKLMNQYRGFLTLPGTHPSAFTTSKVTIKKTKPAKKGKTK